MDADHSDVHGAKARELLYTFVPDGCLMGPPIPRVDVKGSAGATALSWTTAKRSLLFLGESHARALNHPFLYPHAL